VSNSDTPIDVHPLDDVAAYALDALEGPERQAVSDHLAGCPTCRDELSAHQETLTLLAPEEAPPPALWDRIAADIASPSSAPAPVTALPTPSTSRPSPRPSSSTSASASTSVSRPRSSRGGGWLAAAAAVVVALGVGGTVGFAAGRSGDDTDIDTLAREATEVATLTAPGGDPVARVVSDDDGAYLVLDGLENLPEGRAYQLWSLTEAQPVSLGMLGRAGNNTVAFRLPPTITDLAITEAPTSGDATPAGDFVAEGTIAA
jgi:hypothetical protein